MPRSSRSKSHKQSKHSSKDAAVASTVKDYSDSDEDVKIEKRSSNGGKEDAVSFRLSKDSSVSGERRKHGKDLFSSHGNGDVSEEYTTSSKRREEKSHGGSDRWNGGSSEEKVVVVNIENKESLKSKDFSKIVGESKSKSSRRHDAESASVVVLEKDEGKSGSGNRGEKRKSEKESARKENSQYKENKESKDKDRGSDRGRKSHPDKHEAEASSKQVENQSSKRGKESTEWPIEEGLRNPELEKELEKRMRRRGEGSSDKDKKEEGVRETRQRDEKHREDGERDRKSRDVKHRGESERYNKHRDDKHREDKYSEDGNKEKKYHEDGKRREDKHMESGEKDERSRDGKRKQDDDREYRHKEEKHHRDDRHRDEEKRSRESKYTSKDHPNEPEAKRLRDDSASTDLYHRKTNNRDGSPVYDDRNSRYKDDKDRRRGNDKEEGSDHRSRSMKSESEKRSSTKADSVSERGRPGSRHVDMEITGSHSHSRRRSSPPSRDHHRVSKQDESKYRDYVYEERGRHNVQSSRDFASASGQSDKPSTQKVTQKDNDNSYMGDVSRVRPDTRSSPRVDKSPSDPRRSLDLEDPGQRSGGGGSKDAVKEAHPDNEYSQVDGDNLSVSSPYTRNSHFSEDDRNKSNNRHRRMGDPNNMGRAQNNWKNVPNWPSPMAPSGYIPFQHVPPPMFHPLMQQFPPPLFGRPPMKLPYHVPDHNRPLAWRDESVPPPPLHGWDANNNPVFGDESHLYWDRRNQMNNRGWDPNADMWKGQNSMDVQQSGSGQRPSDEIWSGQAVENEQNQVETQVADRNTPEPEKVNESPQIFEAANKKEDDNTLILQAYLSRVDVSEDLTQPEVYDQCRSMMDLDHEALSDEFDCKILFLEEGVDADVVDGTSLFAGINDSVFQKAMIFYKKQKEEFDLKNGEKVPECDQEKSGPAAAEEETGKENDEAAAAAGGTVQMIDTISAVKEEANVSDDEPKKMEVDVVVVKQEEEAMEEESVAAAAGGGGGGSLVAVGCKVEEEETVSDDVSIEFGSVVNLSRIHHHSPESTH